jgi:hypothetical protein
MSRSSLLDGAVNNSANDSVSAALSLNPLTPSEPSDLARTVFGFLPSAGGLEAVVPTVAEAASFERLETGECKPVGVAAFLLAALVDFFLVVAISCFSWLQK